MVHCLAVAHHHLITSTRVATLPLANHWNRWQHAVFIPLREQNLVKLALTST